MNIKKQKSRGKFIVIEGIDGSGLSTQAGKLKEALSKEGWITYLTKEPTDGPAGGVVRLALKKRINISSETFALLFAADRVDHLKRDILPKLDAGVNVICDRYYFSNFAYQGIDTDRKWLMEINSKCIVPDIVIFLDVPPFICKKRMELSRMHVEYYEELPKLEKVREQYVEVMELFKREGINIVTIDGNRPISQVNEEIIGIVSKFLSRKI
ncbi:MAG: dTMP kinase [Candidatus Methanofastidiosia archaeon]